MAVYMIFKYSKRFRFAPSFNNRGQLDCKFFGSNGKPALQCSRKTYSLANGPPFNIYHLYGNFTSKMIMFTYKIFAFRSNNLKCSSSGYPESKANLISSNDKW